MRAGKEFELEVKAALQREIRSGKIGVLPGSAEVFHGKPYKSFARGSIVADVSVEICQRGGTTPWLVWVWECKDYSHPVPVDDVEEFSAKLLQIGVHKTKGTVVCRHGFQSGALDYARAMGIGLARLLPDGSIIHLVEAATEATPESIQEGLIEEATERLTSTFYGISTSGNSTSDFSELVARELSDVIRAEAAFRKEAARPKLDVTAGSLSRLTTGIEVDWKLSKTSGEDIGKLEWRYRNPRCTTEWRQVDVSALSRTHIGANIDLAGAPGQHDKVGENELGLEIRFYWRGRMRYELHRWPLSRFGEEQRWDVGPERLDVLRWDE